jgi:hypothetical protein
MRFSNKAFEPIYVPVLCTHPARLIRLALITLTVLKVKRKPVHYKAIFIRFNFKFIQWTIEVAE